MIIHWCSPLLEAHAMYLSCACCASRRFRFRSLCEMRAGPNLGFLCLTHSLTHDLHIHSLILPAVAHSLAQPFCVFAHGRPYLKATLARYRGSGARLSLSQTASTRPGPSSLRRGCCCWMGVHVGGRPCVVCCDPCLDLLPFMRSVKCGALQCRSESALCGFC